MSQEARTESIRDESEDRTAFVRPEQYLAEQSQRMESNEGMLCVASCTSGTAMAQKIVDHYRGYLDQAGSGEQVLFLPSIDQQFSDTETHVRIPHHVSGSDVFLVQALCDPISGRSINENYLAFLIAARGFREHGANRITAVLPYLAYGRQDKPTKFRREPTTAKLMADLGHTAGIDRVLSWDPHAPQIVGFYGTTPTNMLDPLNLFTLEFERFRNRDDVIAVAPDAGATKLIMHFSRALGINSAIASKVRPNVEEAEISEIIGNFRGKRVAVVLDDILSSAGTVRELVRILVEEKGIEEVHLGISHNLCLPDALETVVEMHERLGLAELVVTDSIPQTPEFSSLPFLSVRSLSQMFALTINRIHYNRSVSEVFIRQ
ncbi:ribose-phosphate diphosphokinase [Salinispira pacifica]